MPKYRAKRFNKEKDTKYRQKHYYIINNNSDVSHIYYDLNAYNNNSGYDKDGLSVPIQSSQQCIFNQMRSKPYLDNPSDYEVTIIKFNLDSNSFPNQIVQPLVGVPVNNDGSYDTVYSIYVGTERINITWVPADMTLRANPPTSGLELVTKEMITNEYFYNYSYQYFLDRINIIIGKLNIFFRFNPVTGLISLNGKYPLNGLQGSNIYVNEQLYNLLAGFQYQYYYDKYGIDTPVYQLLATQVQDVIGNLVYEKVEPQYTSFNTAPLTNTFNSIITIQSYPSTQLWNPVVSIVFTSKSLAVVADDEAKPYIYGLNPNPPVGNSNVSINLFEYSLGRRADPVINFVNFVYLFKSLVSNDPESDLNLETFWKDDYGNLHPFFIESGSNFNLKLMFRKHRDV
jgi:hypothetical protein